jgi:ribokinase
VSIIPDNITSINSVNIADKNIVDKNDSSYDVITVGSATIDTFIHTDDSQTELLEVHQHTDLCYPLGAKILIKELRFFTGGGGTNTAVAFSRLGLKTGLLGRIGSDANGDTVLRELSAEKIDFLGRTGGINGYSVILDSIASDRTIFTFKGCNDDLLPKDIHILEKNVQTKWLYFCSMMDKSFKTMEKLSVYATKKKIKIAFNPSLYLARKGKSYLKNILKNIEILIYNKQEAQALLDSKSENIFELLEETVKLGPKIIVITDADNGAFCYNTYEKMFYSGKPEKVKIKETTGAGDAFASGFVASIIRGKNIEYALKLGMINAESVISNIGAKNILLGEEAFRLAETDRRIVDKKAQIL